MKPPEAERIMDALAANAVRRSQQLEEGTPERLAAERAAFGMVRDAVQPEPPLPDVLSLDQARKVLAAMEGDS